MTTHTTLLRYELRVVQTVHHLIIAFIVSSPIWSWFALDPMTALVISLVAIWRIFSHVKCPVTELENIIRTKLHMSRIKGFIGHYYIKPIYRFIVKNSWNQRG